MTLVAAVGPQPGAPRVVRAGKYSELLKAFGLVDPVPEAFRVPFAVAWRALAEGVERVYVAPDAASLAELNEPMVVAGCSEVPKAEHAGPRIWLYDPPAAGTEPGAVPAGMVGLWPWVRGVLPGLSGAVPLPPSVYAAGLCARGADVSTWAADPVAGPAPEAGWVRLIPGGKRRLLHLDPAPPRPGTAFPAEEATESELAMLWAEAGRSENPVAAFTRSVQSRYGAGVRVVLEDAALRVLFPAPRPHPGGLILRIGRR